MGDPAALVESTASPVVTAIPAVIVGEMQGKERVPEKDGAAQRSREGERTSLTFMSRLDV